MSDAQRYLLCVDQSPQEAAEICTEVAKKLEQREIKLLDVVQSLEEYLTNEDATVRAKAVAYYAGVLGALDPKFLTRQQISVSVQFFCDRIQDASGLKEAAQGLRALQKAQRFAGEDATQTARALFSSAQDLPRHPQGTRFAVITLVNALMSDRRPALKEMGEGFIVGITDLVSGEKDPRNLMTLFDSVFCYFPITFRPPPDDPFKITSQDLKTRLRECIASTSLFASYAFPALLDKLDNTSLNVKKDVIQTITACTRAYTPAAMANYSVQLWDALKIEILAAQDDELVDEALTAVGAIAACLSPDQAMLSTPKALARYLNLIIKEASEQLHEPQQKLAKPFGQILGVVSAASVPAFTLVVVATMPPILTIYQDAGTVGKQRALLEVIGRLLESAMVHYGAWNSRDPYPESANPLERFKDRLYEVFSRALMGSNKDDVSLRLVALQGLHHMTELRKLLADEEIGMVVQYFDDILLEEVNGSEELRHQTTQALRRIASLKPPIVLDITFPAFLARLPDSSTGASEEYLSSLEVLAKLSVEEHIFEVLLRRLLNKLELILVNRSSPQYVCAILSTILYVLDKRELATDPKLDMYLDNLVVGLVGKVFQPLKGNGQSTALNDESALHVVGKLCNIIIRALPVDRQQRLASDIYALFDPEFNTVDRMDSPSIEQRRIIILSTYIVASVRREVPMAGDMQSLFTRLIDWSLQESDTPTRAALLVHISILTNKWLLAQNRDTVQETITKLQIELGTNQESTHPPAKETALVNNSLNTLFWITKAAVLRNDPLSLPLLTHLRSLLSHPQYGLPTARGFSILVSPHELLSSANFVTIRLLHKQRLFSHCSQELVTAFSKADPPVRPNYLIALAGLLKHLPTEVIMPQLDVLLPLLLQSIDLPDANVKFASLEVLLITLQEAPKTVEGHISSVINRLVASLAPTQSANPPRVRITALRCLQVLPTAFASRTELILPHRRALVKNLVISLDDPKRDVRKEAVDCRRAWLRVDEARDH
ncbi:MAG: hypothetical protein M1823_003737 [Watsoniomyces obsoletus]|nr:MAG: hypothetical protein M1823_003737 [Watsoniomyces obsoletus]